MPLRRYTPAAIGIAMGLMASLGTSFRPPNFLYNDDVFLIINELVWEDEFVHLYVIAFLLALRIPSGALLMKRAFSDGGISGFVAQPDKVIIGVMKCGSLDA